MGNAASTSIEASRKTTSLPRSVTRIQRKVSIPSRPSSTTNYDQEKIFQEYPELIDTLSYIDVIVKGMYNHKEADVQKKTMNLSTKKSLDELCDFYFQYEDHHHREMIGDKLAKTGVTFLMVEYMKILTKDGEDYPFEGYIYQCYQTARALCWNYTDASTKLCEEFGKMGMLPLMLEDLKKFQHTFTESSEKHFIVLSAMSILHNCASSSANTKYYKEINAVDTVAWYAKNCAHETEQVLTPLSNMTLALIVDEQNNDVILADDTVIKTILQLLAQSLTEEQHRSEGFSATELTFGLTRLANNEENSVVIVKNGILKSLLRMMEEGSDTEQTTAAKAVWVLAFSDKNKTEISSNQKLVDLLRSFSSLHSTVSTKLKRAAGGALWVLGQPSQSHLASKFKAPKKKKVAVKKFESIEDQSNLSSPSSVPLNISPDKDTQLEEKLGSSKEVVSPGTDVTSPRHVMISYQWDCQKLILKVKRQLESHGYKVWMDLDEMEGSTLESMAKGVENSDVLLVCFTQKYKDSVSCRTEAEYAYKLGKAVIPLRIEQDYSPDGWLGAIVGVKLYHDFTNQSAFDATFSSLLKEIGDRGKLKRLDAPKASTLPASSDDSSVNDWTANDVSKWSNDHQLSNLKTRNLDGNCLLFFKKLKHEAPEFFYRYITEQLKLKDIRDIMNFADAIEGLS